MAKKTKKSRNSRTNSTDGEEDASLMKTTPQKEAMELESPKTTPSKKSKKKKQKNERHSTKSHATSDSPAVVSEHREEPLAPTQKPVLMSYELLGQSSQGYLQPLVTSFVGGQRFVIMPQKRFLTILSYNTGQRIGTLVLELSQKTPQGAPHITVECVALATRPLLADTSSKSSHLANIWKQGAASANLQVLLVGCSDGSIREFSIAELLQPSTSNNRLFDAGDFLLTAPIYTPKHVYQVAQTGKKIEYMSFSKESQGKDRSVNHRIGYALIQSDDDKTSKLIRFQLPSNPASEFVNLQNVDNGKSISIVHSKIRHSSMDGKATQSPIVALLTTSQDLVILVQARIIRIFDTARNAHASYKLSATDPITAASMYHDSHLACGLKSGKITLLHEFGLVYKRHFLELQKAQKLASQVLPPSVIERTVHWHAHSVSSLSFESASASDEPFLFSGGTESVLVGWQLARGVDRPNWTLPRLASADIVHVLHISRESAVGQRESAPTTMSSSGSNNAVLVYCNNGTCMLIQTHNRRVQWKVDSLVQSPIGDQAHSTEENHSMRIRSLPKKDNSVDVAFFGSHSTCGHIQLLDPTSLKFSSSAIEIAPYNRTSRTDSDQADLPRPRVALADFSSQGDMITFDEVATEINAPGHEESMFIRRKVGTRSKSAQAFGLERRLKFWHKNHEVAEISTPHGKNNTVNAIAISQSTGAFACTVSSDAKTVRVWQKLDLEAVSSDSVIESAPGADHPKWKGQYEIAIPYGFSHLTTGSQAVAFSADDSLLAIGFGSQITLWDVEAQAILAALPHDSRKKKEVIESIAFTPASSRQQDMLLTRSKNHIVFQSPFGHKSMVEQGWRWEVDPKLEAEISITGAEYICNQYHEELVAVSVFRQSTQKSALILLDSETGSILNNERVEVPGKVVDFCSFASHEKSLASTWGDSGDQEINSTHHGTLDLAFVVQEGFAYRWTRGQETDQSGSSQIDAITSSTPAAWELPSAPIMIADHLVEATRKRKMAPRAMTTLDLSDLSGTTKQKLSVNSFGHVEGEEMEEELPLLRGVFAQSFLARHLFKKQKTE